MIQGFNVVRPAAVLLCAVLASTATGLAEQDEELEPLDVYLDARPAVRPMLNRSRPLTVDSLSSGTDYRIGRQDLLEIDVFRRRGAVPDRAGRGRRVDHDAPPGSAGRRRKHQDRVSGDDRRTPGGRLRPQPAGHGSSYATTSRRRSRSRAPSRLPARTRCSDARRCSRCSRSRAGSTAN